MFNLFLKKKRNVKNESCETQSSGHRFKHGQMMVQLREEGGFPGSFCDNLTENWKTNAEIQQVFVCACPYY